MMSFISEKHVDFDTSPYKEDIHVITGSLKLYFRELPEPLLTFGAYDHLISAVRKLIMMACFTTIARN